MGVKMHLFNNTGEAGKHYNGENSVYRIFRKSKIKTCGFILFLCIYSPESSGESLGLFIGLFNVKQSHKPQKRTGRNRAQSKAGVSADCRLGGSGLVSIHHKTY